MLQAYLVDFDGTLADTGDANYLAYAAALHEVGVAIDREQFDSQAFGRNWRQFLPVLLKDHACDADPAAVAARKAVHYRAAAANIRFNDALIFLLQHRGEQTRAALVTSASAANVGAALASRANLRQLFDAIVTGDDVSRHKPDPQGYEIAAKLLRVEAEHCLVLEDSIPGIEAGMAFGAQVLKISF